MHYSPFLSPFVARYSQHTDYDQTSSGYPTIQSSDTNITTPLDNAFKESGRQKFWNAVLFIDGEWDEMGYEAKREGSRWILS